MTLTYLTAYKGRGEVEHMLELLNQSGSYESSETAQSYTSDALEYLKSQHANSFRLLQHGLLWMASVYTSTKTLLQYNYIVSQLRRAHALLSDSEADADTSDEDSS